MARTRSLCRIPLPQWKVIRQPAPVRLRVWLVGAATVVVTGINPYGPRLLPYIANELTRAHPITEWQPIDSSDTSHFIFMALFGVFGATLPFARHWRDEGWERVLALGVGLMAWRHQRHASVFALCSVAPLAGFRLLLLSWYQEWVTCSVMEERVSRGTSREPCSTRPARKSLVVPAASSSKAP